MIRTKLIKIAKRINPCGGIYFVIDRVKKIGLSKLIDRSFPVRAKQSKYKYSDIILGWCFSMMCGAQRLEDTKQLKNNFIEDIPETKIPSPDRIAWIFKKISIPSHTVLGEKGSVNELNINYPLNHLLLKCAEKMNFISSGVDYTLDYDTTLIATKKFDSKTTYEHFKGYNPGVAFIGKTPVYIEGRNGNTSPSFQLQESVMNALDLLKEKGISIKRFRCDGAGYQFDLMKELCERNIEFFIRARNSHFLLDEITPLTLWTDVELNGYRYQVATIRTRLYKGGPIFRAIVSRNIDIPSDKLKDYVEEEFNCRILITNNTSMTAEEVFRFYNQRGSIENNFANLKNDFNWKRLPFSFLHENTVFMILSAIAYMIYQYILKTFSQKINFVNQKMELKNFIFHFISVALEWVKEGPIIYTDKSYEKLLE